MNGIVVDSGVAELRTFYSDRLAEYLSHIQALLCDASVGGRVRHSDHPGAFGAKKREDNDDIHPRLNRGPSGVRSPLDKP